jgi:DNA-binding MarR family transcriptional regulator
MPADEAADTERACPTGPDRQANEAAFDAVAALFTRMVGHLQERSRGSGLQPPAVKALRLIDSTVSMKELGRRLHCDASFVTAVADSLEDLGLVRREMDPDDRRVKNLVLTRKGAAVRSRLADQCFADLPGFLALDVDERAEFLRLVHKMLADPAAAEAG